MLLCNHFHSLSKKDFSAAADRRVVHHHAAGAAVLEHAAEAVAAGLDHLAALGVAAGAGDADAVLGRLAAAQAHEEVAGGNRHAVPLAGAADHAAGHRRAQVLHHAAGRAVLAATVNLD